jgi:alpha-amylase
MKIQNLYNKYNQKLQTDLKGYGVLNYMSSHDDSSPFDPLREKPFETGTKLLLAPGASQVYYGDESARILKVEGAEGDANLRSFMNWEEQEANAAILTHWQKLGQFRAKHPAVGAGVHKQISSSPFVFSRIYQKGNAKDAVVVVLNAKKGKKVIDVSGVFDDGSKVLDAYSQQEAIVNEGKVELTSDFDIVLLEIKQS